MSSTTKEVCSEESSVPVNFSGDACWPAKLPSDEGVQRVAGVVVEVGEGGDAWCRSP